MRELNTYYVADNTSEIELEKTVESMIDIGYERIGEMVACPVPGTTTLIFIQVLGQFKDER